MGVQPHWCAVWTRGRHEKKVASELDEAGIEHCLPLIKRTQQWSDRRKIVDFPLFPGYLFARPRAEDLHTIYRIDGVAGVLGHGGKYPAISEKEMEDIRRVTGCSLPLDLYPSLPVGKKVRVVSGILSGLKGTLVRWKNSQSVVVTVNLIQQGAAVNVSPQDLEPL